MLHNPPAAWRRDPLCQQYQNQGELSYVVVSLYKRKFEISDASRSRKISASPNLNVSFGSASANVVIMANTRGRQSVLFFGVQAVIIRILFPTFTSSMVLPRVLTSGRVQDRVWKRSPHMVVHVSGRSETAVAPRKFTVYHHRGSSQFIVESRD
jgi:hypothetical protein